MSTALSAGAREKPAFLMAVVNNVKHPFKMQRRRRMGRKEGEEQ